MGQDERSDRLVQARLGRRTNAAPPTANPTTTMTLPIQNHFMSPVMMLPGM
jgi:hypothetical protein